MNYEANTSPRLRNILSKLPSCTSLSFIKAPATSEESRTICIDESPPLKRKRSKSSSSNTPDIRRKLLSQSVERRLESVSIILQEKENSNAADSDPEVFSVSLDEIDICPVAPSEEKSPSAVVEHKRVEKLQSFKPPKLSIEAVDWVKVLRTKRKSRLYRIEATGEEEGFEAVHRAADLTKVPASINGRRPFKVIPGVEYGLVLGEEVAGGDELAEEKEIKMIENENYLLDSFVCDVGYLSDDELNETPCRDKVESKVKRLRRANNIKEKRKLELLTEPQVIGPFWVKGGRGCKKELKKWQTMVLSSLPMSTSFSRPVPEYISRTEMESASLPTTLRQESEAVTVTVTAQVEALRPDVRSSKIVGGREEDYETKYHIKYLVRSLVQGRMRGRVRVASPEDCSPPMVTQEELLYAVSRHTDGILSNNPETVRKYVTKYRHKFSYNSL